MMVFVFAVCRSLSESLLREDDVSDILFMKKVVCNEKGKINIHGMVKRQG